MNWVWAAVLGALLGAFCVAVGVATRRMDRDEKDRQDGLTP